SVALYSNTQANCVALARLRVYSMGCRVLAPCPRSGCGVAIGGAWSLLTLLSCSCARRKSWCVCIARLTRTA
ncbi:hypothetical protein LPJ54_003135, partial [Coemansia sp. RSA 1824]